MAFENKKMQNAKGAVWRGAPTTMAHGSTRLKENASAASRSDWLGFTLIEMMAGIAIMMVLATVGAMLFRESLAAWTAGVQRAERDGAARVALQMMARDLRQAVEGHSFRAGLDTNSICYGFSNSIIAFESLQPQYAATLYGTNNEHRAIIRIEYYVSEVANGTDTNVSYELIRSVTAMGPTATNRMEAPLAANVAGLAFNPHSAFMPYYVDIGLSLLDEQSARQAAYITNLTEQIEHVHRNEKLYSTRVFLRSSFEYP